MSVWPVGRLNITLPQHCDANRFEAAFVPRGRAFQFGLKDSDYLDSSFFEEYAEYTMQEFSKKVGIKVNVA